MENKLIPSNTTAPTENMDSKKKRRKPRSKKKMLNMADTTSHSNTIEEALTNACSRESASSLVLTNMENNETPSSPATMAATVDCVVKTKKKRWEKIKKLKLDKHLPASTDFYDLSYEPDQWSPTNFEGKKKYSRRFLLRLRFHPICLKKPDGLNARIDIAEIVLGECLQEGRCHLCSGPAPESKVVRTANCSDSVVKATKALVNEMEFKILPEGNMDSVRAFLCGSSKLNENTIYSVLNMKKVTVMPTIQKTEIPAISNKDLMKPPNPHDRKKYDRNFLLKRHSHPLCLKRPQTLTCAVLIVQKNPLQHEKCHVCKMEDLDELPTEPIFGAIHYKNIKSSVNALEKEGQDSQEQDRKELGRQDQPLEEMQLTIHSSLNFLEKERQDFQKQYKEEMARQDQLLEEMEFAINSTASSRSRNTPDVLQWKEGKWKISNDDDMKILMGLLDKERTEWKEKYRQLLGRQDERLEELSKFDFPGTCFPGMLARNPEGISIKSSD